VGRRIAEEYRPTGYGSVISRTTPYQQDPTASFLERQAAITEAKADKERDRMASLLTDPVESYQKQRDRAYDRAVKEKQMLLAEEQAATAKLNRDLEQQYGARQREASISGSEAQSQYQRLLADRALAEEQFLSKVDEATGKTMRQRQLEAPITAAEKEVELAQERLSIDRENARIAAQTAAQQRELNAMQINQMKNAEATKALVGRYQYATSPEEKKAIIDGVIKSGNPSVAYDALSQIKDGEQRAEFTRLVMANSDPGYQLKFQTTAKATEEQREVSAALSELKSIKKQLEDAPAMSEDADQAGERAAVILERYGLFNDAKAMRESFQFNWSNIPAGQNPVVSRTQKLDSAIRNVAAEAANAVERKYPDVPSVKQWAENTRKTVWDDASKLNVGNIFGPKTQSDPFAMPSVPVTPAQYYGGGGQQTAMPQQSQSQPPPMQPQPGQQQMSQVPQADPFMQFLSRGRPVQQTGGK
jgi:hypothetical protein